jgi:DNA-binding transcriptional LysR family regulator
MKTALDDILTTDRVTTVSTTSAFALLKLVPELPLFYAKAPGTRVQIDTSTHSIELRQNRRVDVAIRYGSSERIVHFDEEHFVLQAAMAGQGIALASSALVADLVARKLLVPLRPEVQLKDEGYTALCLEEHAKIRKVRVFLDWLGARFS